MISKESRKKMGWRKGKLFTAFYKNCEICGSEFKTTPSSKKQFCCSRECWSKRKTKKRVKYICLVCGKDIYALKRKAGGRKYCSTKCKIDALAEMKRKRFENKRIWGEWKNWRTAKEWYLTIYKKCQICGYEKIKEILEMHHKDRNRYNNKKDNLILLCPNCHSEEHYNKKDGQFKNNLGKYAIN